MIGKDGRATNPGLEWDTGQWNEGKKGWKQCPRTEWSLLQPVSGFGLSTCSTTQSQHKPALYILSSISVSHKWRIGPSSLHTSYSKTEQWGWQAYSAWCPKGNHIQQSTSPGCWRGEFPACTGLSCLTHYPRKQSEGSNRAAAAGSPSEAAVLHWVAGEAWGHLCMVGSQCRDWVPTSPWHWSNPSPSLQPPPSPVAGVMVRDGGGQ